MLLLIGILSGGEMYVRAQHTIIPARHVTMADGLPTDMVWSSARDKIGFMWFATEDGLLRYDGFEFLTWRNDPSNPAGLDDSWVYDVVCDSDGMIWCCTHREVYRMNPNTLHLERIHFLPSNFTALSPLDMVVNTLFEDSSGEVWIGTSQGIFVLDKERKLRRHFQEKESSSFKGYINHVLALTEGPGGEIWANSAAGLLLIASGATEWELVPIPEQIYHDRGILFHQGLLYTGGERMSSFNPSTGEIKTCLEHSDTRGLLCAIAADPYDSQKLWCGIAGGGLMGYHLSTEKKETITAKSDDDTQLPGYVFSISIIDDVLWATCSNGIFQFLLGQNFIRTINASNVLKSPQSVIYNIFPSYQRSENTYAYVTTSEGIYQCNFSKNEWIPLKDSILKDFNGQLAPENIRDVYEDKQGALWICTNEIGVVRCINGNCTIEVNNEELPQRSNNYYWYISMVRESPDSSIYVCADTRLIHIRHGIKTILEPPPILDERGDTLMTLFSLAKMSFDDAGRLWLISEFQPAKHIICLVRYDPSNGVFDYFYHKKKGCNFPFAQNIMQFERGDDGLFWIALESNGLVSFDPREVNPSFTHIPTSTLVNNSYCSGVMPTRSVVWAATRNGLIARFKDGTYRIINESVGLHRNRITTNLKRTSQDEIGVFSTRQIQLIHEKNLTPRPLPSRIALTRIALDQEPYLKGQAAFSIKEIETTWKKNSLTLDYTAFNFGVIPDLEFGYLMDGFDTQWINNGASHTVRYSTIPPGRYTFKMRVRAGNGEWSNVLLEIPVRVQQAWFLSWWFFIVLAMLLFGSGYWFYRYRLNQIKLLQEVRNRIAKDLHDEVGSSLSSIAIYGELISTQLEKNPATARQMAHKLQETATDSVERMRDIVWSLSERNDSFQNMLQHMRRTAEDLLDTKNIALEFHAEERLNELHLPVEIRKELYLIFKEAINNARKHSIARIVLVEIHLNGSMLVLEMQDNGIGFDVNHAYDGNGLGNIRKRAEEIHAELHIESTSEKGTRIMLRVPIRYPQI